MKCPKCKATSGDDWSQCQGSCPMPMSPYYKAAMKLREQLESTDDDLAKPMKATEESYTKGIQVLAKHMLKVLDKKGKDWEPETDSVNALSSDLYPQARTTLPEYLFGQFSGGQVQTAGHLAYRAFKGD